MWFKCLRLSHLSVERQPSIGHSDVRGRPNNLLPPPNPRKTSHRSCVLRLEIVSLTHFHRETGRTVADQIHLGRCSIEPGAVPAEQLGELLFRRLVLAVLPAADHAPLRAADLRDLFLGHAIVQRDVDQLFGPLELLTARLVFAHRLFSIVGGPHRAPSIARCGPIPLLLAVLTATRPSLAWGWLLGPLGGVLVRVHLLAPVALHLVPGLVGPRRAPVAIHDVRFVIGLLNISPRRETRWEFPVPV